MYSYNNNDDYSGEDEDDNLPDIDKSSFYNIRSIQLQSNSTYLNCLQSESNNHHRKHQQLCELTTVVLLSETVDACIKTLFALQTYLDNDDPLLISTWWELKMSIIGFYSAVQELNRNIISKSIYQIFYQRAKKLKLWLENEELDKNNNNDDVDNNNIKISQFQIKKRGHVRRYGSSIFTRFKLDALNSLKNSFRLGKNKNIKNNIEQQQQQQQLPHQKTRSFILNSTILPKKNINTFGVPTNLTNNTQDIKHKRHKTLIQLLNIAPHNMQKKLHYNHHHQRNKTTITSNTITLPKLPESLIPIATKHHRKRSLAESLKLLSTSSNINVIL